MTSTAAVRRWPLATLAGLLIAAVSSGAARPPRHLLPVSYTVTETTAASAAPADVDVFGVWVQAARQTHEKVRDYQCTFLKQERIKGALEDEQSAAMKLRVQPFSVHLKFLAPKAVAGREAAYVAGRNNGKMKAKAGGPIGLVGYVTIDLRDPKAMQGTRHTINEAGIGNLIERSTAAVESRLPGPHAPQVTVSEANIARRSCVRIDVIDPGADGSRTPYRSVIFFDKETNLPIRFEGYDRPRGGAPGDLLECYTYLDLKFNVGLTDAAFGH